MTHLLFLILPVALHLLHVLLQPLGSAAPSIKDSPVSAGSGDSLSVSTQRDEDTQEIDSICKSWDDFHDCANVAMAGCPEEAAVVWESLRQESKRCSFLETCMRCAPVVANHQQLLIPRARIRPIRSR